MCQIASELTSLAVLAMASGALVLAEDGGSPSPRLLEVRQHTHGQWTVSQIVESEGPFVDPQAFYSGIRMEEIRQACPPGKSGKISDDGKLVFATQIFLVQKPGLNVLIDMGSGNDKDRPQQPWWHHQHLPLVETLAHLGVKPEDVDYALLTHLHDDHVGFATTFRDGRWVPTFPRARYAVSKADWDHFTRLPQSSRHPSVDDSVLPLAGVVDFVRPGEQRAGFVIHGSPAHTPGLLLYEIKDANVWFVGDLLHHPAQLARPEWKSADYDLAPGSVGKERRRYYSKLARSHAAVYAAHIGDPYEVLRDGKTGFTGRIWGLP
jgi:glyoxylase-like metal-dependent hydrolase (beta-lactamase superfamily II)